MRQISAHLLDAESLAELKSGRHLQLVVESGRIIAEIIPVAESPSEEERPGIAKPFDV